MARRQVDEGLLIGHRFRPVSRYERGQPWVVVEVFRRPGIPIHARLQRDREWKTVSMEALQDREFWTPEPGAAR